MTDAQWRCAAVAYGPADDVDTALANAVEVLLRAGRRVGGLLFRRGEQNAAGKRDMFLRVLPDGETIRLSDRRGPGVQGCALDAHALSLATMAFRTGALARPDLLVADRFGKQEAAGGGLRAELAEALLAGVPLLVPVRTELLADWERFLGEPGEVLPPDADAILAWAGRANGGPYLT